jgi:D-alanyl-D-alanine carboxypeptidase (penicillin-binding protein 5/6)
LTPPATASAESLQLQWPATGQAAIAADGYDLLAGYSSDTPVATASIAKVITALCILQKYPLSVGQTGPTLTFTKQDAAFYQYQLQHNGSSVAVYEGEQMTEYEALEAMLIPSANNIADSLASWAFGNLDNYALYANTYVLQHGLVKTHVGIDASGLDPSTVSTAADLAKIGLLARSEPVIMSIVAKESTTIPNVGVVHNYNKTLGVNGINGLKTGNNDQNRGALLFTADLKVADKTIAISGVVLSQSSLQNALTASTQLVGSIAANFEWYTYVEEGQIIGTASVAWGGSVPVRAAETAQLLRWRGDAVTTRQTVHATTADKPASIGALLVAAGPMQTSVTLQLDSSASGPDYWWRATRL